MATLKEIQDAIDNNTFDPGKYDRRQRKIIDAAIDKGLLKGPKTSDLINQRAGAAKDVATMDEAVKNPIGVRLQQEGSSLDGRSEAVLAGDLIGSITPYVAMRKKIFSAAKSKVPGDKSTGLFARTKMFSNFADKLTARLPGRFKLLGGLTKLLAKVADPTVGRVLASPLGRSSKDVRASIEAIGRQLESDIRRQESLYTTAGGLETTLKDLRKLKNFEVFEGEGGVASQLAEDLSLEEIENIIEGIN